MPAAPLPEDEKQRLASLEAMGILDTPAEGRFDRLARLARQLFHTRYSMITLIDKDRQWFKSAQGMPLCETPRGVAICGYTILSDEPLVVPDASVDERLFDNPVVVGEPKIRFYAGVPVHNRKGHRVGTICVLDSEAREVASQEIQGLQDLAACVEAELQLARSTRAEQQLLRELDSLRLKTLVDPVTRCWNPEALRELSERQDRPVKGTTAVLLAVELADFAELNRTRGPAAGDGLLRELADRLRSGLHANEILARSRGPRFLLLSNVRVERAEARGKELHTWITQPSLGDPLPGCRIGVCSRRTLEDLTAWIQRAELVLQSTTAGRPVVQAV